MIKDINFLKESIKNFLVKPLKDKTGFLLELDGTLESVVMYKILKEISEEYEVDLKLRSYIFGKSNSYKINHIKSIVDQLNIKNHQTEDLDNKASSLQLIKYYGEDVNKQVVVQQRLIRMHLTLLQDLDNLIRISATHRDKWLVNFPSSNLKDKNDFYPLASLSFEEIKQLARHLDVPERLIEKNPTSFYYRNQEDYKDLGFTYKHVDNFVKNNVISTIEDIKIQKLFKDDRGSFQTLLIQRPSKALV